MSIETQPGVKWRMKGYAEDILNSGQFSLGPLTEAFERTWGEIHEGHAVATSSGTTALELVARIVASRVSGQAPYRPIVAVPANLMPAVPWAFERQGFQVLLMDVDPTNGCSSLADVEAIYRRRRLDAVVIVHNGGVIHPSTPEIAAFCKECGIALVEDCSHAHGCVYDEVRAGMFSDYAAWSFYPTKVLIGSEGGVALFRNEEDAEAARVYSNQGKTRGSGTFGDRGYNLRPSEFSAALMLAETQCRDAIYNERRQMMLAYLDRSIPVKQGVDAKLWSTCYKFTVVLKTEEAARRLESALRTRGFYPTGATFRPSLLDKFGSYEPMLGVKSWEKTHVNLPWWRGMSEDDMKRAAAAVVAASEEAYR